LRGALALSQEVSFVSAATRRASSSSPFAAAIARASSSSGRARAAPD
jgi:hypothetical protein